MSNSIKPYPGVGEWFHADGWTDMTNFIVAFRNSAKAPAMIHSAYRVHTHVF